MLRLVLVLAIILTSPGVSVPAERSGHGGGDSRSSERSDHGGSGQRSERREGGDRGSVDHLRERIERAEGVAKKDKERALQSIDSARSEAAKVEEARGLLRRLREDGRVATHPSERARIEAEVKKQLDRIEQSRTKLSSIRRTLEADVEAAKDLTAEQKAKVKAILRDLVERRINARQAEAALNDAGGAQGGGFVLILVLFALLVVIGAGFGLDYGHY